MRRRTRDRDSKVDSSTNAELDAPAYNPIIVKETLGVWNLAIKKEKSLLQQLPLLKVFELVQYAPYLWRFLTDVFRVSPAAFVIWLLASALNSLLPAVSLYWSSQLLQLVEAAVEKRDVETRALILVAVARCACVVAEQLLPFIIEHGCTKTLRQEMERKFGEHLLRAHIRLDWVTLTDPVVQQKLGPFAPGYYQSKGWNSLRQCVDMLSYCVELVSETFVLGKIIHEHKAGYFFFLVTIVGPALQWIIPEPARTWNSSYLGWSTNEAYLRLRGLEDLAFSSGYRRDIVLGGLQDYIQKEYHRLLNKLGSTAMSFQETWDAHFDKPSYPRLAARILSVASRDIPQVIFAFVALQSPSDIPLSLTWLALLRGAVWSVSGSMTIVLRSMKTLDEELDAIKSLYECANIENQIVDGQEVYPDESTPSDGMGLEFKNIHFKYSGDNWALQGVSFTIGRGQLCVVVGQNGSGKSTVVKLLSRLYEPQMGEILVDGRALRSLRLADYRKSLSILPQEFSYFPLTVAENIGIGDPSNSQDANRIRQAAEMGGSSEFIDGFSEGFNTYLKPSVPTHTNKRDPRWYPHVKDKFLKANSAERDLSGGQWQRLAISRTFMRSSENTRLLCYDEPSAALDPIAEHDLFQRLRQLRGRKTMVFITHRFGHLTRYADKIIYLDSGRVAEQGTHAELMEKKGAYARLYSMQAQAFQLDAETATPADFA